MFVIVIEYTVKIVACVFVADFLSGVFHWLEDAYGREHWPITGRFITRPNVVHHRRPRHFTGHSWFHSAAVLIVLVAVGLAVAYAAGIWNWMTWIVAIFGINANEIHKWAHRTRDENGDWITCLQSLGILQSPQHHAKHHQNGKNTHYCVFTNYLNPLLDAVRLWDCLEWAILRVTGVARRVDHSLARQRPSAADV